MVETCVCCSCVSCVMRIAYHAQAGQKFWPAHADFAHDNSQASSPLASGMSDKVHCYCYSSILTSLLPAPILFLSHCLFSSSFLGPYPLSLVPCSFSFLALSLTLILSSFLLLSPIPFEIYIAHFWLLITSLTIPQPLLPAPLLSIPLDP